jgi:hypothetical protein
MIHFALQPIIAARKDASARIQFGTLDLVILVLQMAAIGAFVHAVGIDANPIVNNVIMVAIWFPTILFWLVTLSVLRGVPVRRFLARCVLFHLVPVAYASPMAAVVLCIGVFTRLAEADVMLGMTLIAGLALCGGLSLICRVAAEWIAATI